jgi:hypothetical protein
MVAVLVLWPALAGARLQQDHAYRYEQVWSAAIRVIRVDYGCTIVERDEETGFFTFEWREGNRTYPGSMEVIRVRVDNQDQVRVVAQVPQMPTYVERMILDRLARKLIEDYGEPQRPPPRPRPTRPGETPDGGVPDGGPPQR